MRHGETANGTNFEFDAIFGLNRTETSPAYGADTEIDTEVDAVYHAVPFGCPLRTSVKFAGILLIILRMEETTDKRANHAVGYAFAVLQAVLYSTMGIFGKLLYATGMDSREAVILRFLCSTVLLGAFMLAWRKERLISRQREVYVQAVFYFASAFLYFFAVERMNAGITTVFFYLYPAMVAAINLAVFHERLTVPVAVALVLSILGLVLISGIVGGELKLDLVGLVFALASALAFAIYTVLIQVTGRTEGSFTVTFTLSWTSLLASCIVFAPSAPTMLALTPYQIGIGCTMALANTILPVVLYIQAVKHIGGTKTSLIGISETPFSLVLAFLILGETIAPMEGLGIVLIVAGIAAITVGPLLDKKGRPD